MYPVAPVTSTRGRGGVMFDRPPNLRRRRSLKAESA
jgi:hypothetical protein